MMTQPRSRSMAETVLLPVAIPPVRPTRRYRRGDGVTSAPGPRRSHLGPVGTRLDVDDDRHGERQRALHDLPGEDLHDRHLLGRSLEQELVVDLKQHARPQPPVPQGRATRTMAILIMSLAVPWTGAFMAMRSAALRA